MVESEERAVLAERHNADGNAYADRGRLGEAIACYHHALECRPDYVEAWNNLGVAQAQAGQLEQAAESYRRALKLKSDHVSAWNNLGLVHAAQRAYREAIECYRQALALNPEYAKAEYNMALAFLAEGRTGEAQLALGRAVERAPHWAEAALHYGAVLETGGRLADAESVFRRALALSPLAYGHLARVLVAQKKYDEALVRYREALNRYPHDAALHNQFGALLRTGGQIREAIGHFEQAATLRPDDCYGWNNLGICCYWIGDLRRGHGALAEAVRLCPEDAAMRSNFLFGHNYHPEFTPEKIFDAHRRWGELFGATRYDLGPPPNDRDPGRRLRVGYVTPDLTDHSVAFFIEPALSRHDRGSIESFLYVESVRNVPDARYKRIRELAARWTDTRQYDDAALATRIRNDQIDILVDLAGHTARNRLPVFAYRPAPVQVTYLGYVNGTGLPAMDYRLTDGYADPAGAEALYTEQLVRLPQAFFCYRPPEDAPPVAESPAGRRGMLTFGSFNYFPKINDQVLERWAEILDKTERTRLLVQAGPLRDEVVVRRLQDFFVGRGIAAERLVFRPSMPFQDYLRSHADVDLMLDTFPHASHTISCHALWMGVPVLTLAGPRYAGRLGVSVLAHLGLNEFVARSESDYVARAVRWAGDRAHLAALRFGLRERMRDSRLCDEARFTRDLEAAYRELWTRWCTEKRRR